jgi:hypothetical protein
MLGGFIIDRKKDEDNQCKYRICYQHSKVIAAIPGEMQKNKVCKDRKKKYGDIFNRLIVISFFFNGNFLSAFATISG